MRKVEVTGYIQHGYDDSAILWLFCMGRVCVRTGPEVIKLFSSSAQLSMKFQLLINVEMSKIVENSDSKLKN